MRKWKEIQSKQRIDFFLFFQMKNSESKHMVGVKQKKRSNGIIIIMPIILIEHLKAHYIKHEIDDDEQCGGDTNYGLIVIQLF